MITCEKIFPSIYKETQGMQRLDYPPLHQDATQNHQRNKERSQFLLPKRQTTQNVPVKIVNPLVDAFSTEISLMFYCLFQIFRPSRKSFRDVTFVYPQ